MYKESKDKTVSFRTFETVDDKLKDLAKRVEKHKWDFPWGNKVRKASSKSGLINEILAENLTFAEIRKELKKVESEKS